MDYMSEIVCAICGLPITGEDYDERHWLHEDDCASREVFAGESPEDDYGYKECDCRFVDECHAECCPDCKEE